MMLVAKALLWVAVAAAPGKGPVQLASPGLTGLNVSKEVVGFYSEHLAQQLRLGGVRVLTSGDMATVLGMEKQKQLLGCADDSATCTVELANALGADGVVVGDLAKLGQSYQLNVRVLSASSGETLAARSAKADSEETLAAAVDQLAGELSAEVHRRLGREVPAGAGLAPVVVAAPPAGVHKAWIPATAGLAATVAGFFIMGGGSAMLAQVRDTDTGADFREAQRKLNAARSSTTIGTSMMAAGAALGIGAGVWRIVSAASGPPVQAGLMVSPSGGAVMVGGTLPWP